jgi:hypothetical protein
MQAEKDIELSLDQTNGVPGDEGARGQHTPEPVDEGGHYEPLQTGAKTPTRALSRAPSTASSTVVRLRSNNGHGCAELEDSADEADFGGGSAGKDPFEVSWDGDDDPFCPRSMSVLHKWTIVLIVGMGSLCV